MIQSFLKYLAESSTVTIYHGDNYNTTKLDVKLMNNGNAEEGVGIYFSDDIESAKTYGKNIVSATINPNNFIDSRATVVKLGKPAIVKILAEMWKSNSEEFFYYVSDFLDVSDENDVKSLHVEQMFDKIKLQQIRHWQVEMCVKFGVEKFVASWNKHLKYDGTKYFRGSDMWYAIINPSVKVTKVS